jgi:RimJ/RimL family protein N-acetyltransferase
MHNANFALASNQARVVRAHTEPDNAASARVLEKCGFSRVGVVIDSEDGPRYIVLPALGLVHFAIVFAMCRVLIAWINEGG